MRKSRFKEEQIIGILKESEAGVPTAELCRKHGIAAQTLCRTERDKGGAAREVIRLERLGQPLGGMPEDLR